LDDAEVQKNGNLMPDVLPTLTVLMPIIALCSCAGQTETKREQKLCNVFVAEGLACWYGSVFEGKKTASGDIFRKNKYTAAHRFLEFGTLVRVTNAGNNKSVVVEINDRGPFSHNRILDLSEKAAHDIDILQKGLGHVHIEICGYKKTNFSYMIKHYKNIKTIRATGCRIK
jgi:rare lipoprotein A